MHKLFVTLVFLVYSFLTFSQTEFLQGYVFEEKKAKKRVPIPYVNLVWAGTDIGTATNEKGRFQIPYNSDYRYLVVSFVGFDTDTIEILNNQPIDIVLKNYKTLDAVEIVYELRSTEISLIDPLNIQSINKKELRKAACCNLAESFDTNASVDASYSNAVTGREQIKMLGLDGKYVQIMEDNIPSIRGLAHYEGLELISGAWIEGIQVSKAAGSVVNGYESITGQINTAIKNPNNNEERFHVNVFANAGSRLEGNVNYSYNVSDNLKGNFLGHVLDLSSKIDNNDDGFIDNPLHDHIIVQNVLVASGKNYEGEFMVKGSFTDTQSGQMEFSPESILPSFYGVQLETNRMEGYAKSGIIFPNSDFASIGLQLKAVYHDMWALMGQRYYEGEEKMFGANLIYQDAFSGERHQFKTGVSYMMDEYEERLDTLNFSRLEKVPGVFFEYNMNGGEAYSLIAGIRVDEHNIYGTLINPRIHARYNPWKNTAFKLAAGKGQRVSNIFNENLDILVSSRDVIISGTDVNDHIYSGSEGAYGLDIEEATTIGINLTQKFTSFEREGSLVIDFYNTNFINQVVMDLDASARQVWFYNLDGRSYSNSIQAELNLEPGKRFQARLAGRWMDVKTDYKDGLLKVPFNSNLRGFLNLAYETRKNIHDQKWLGDITIQYIGEQRLPQTLDNPLQYQVSGTSDPYLLLNAQVTRVLSKDFEVYLGAENILNYKQRDAIIASEDPFGEFFDANFAYAPVFGTNYYVGLRYTVFNKNQLGE